MRTGVWVKGSLAAATATVALTIGSVSSASAASPDAAKKNTPAVISEAVSPQGGVTTKFANGASFSSSPLMAGSFSWNANYDIAVFSRYWTTSGTGDIWVDINSITRCGPYTHTLKLLKNGPLGTSSYVGSSRNVSCSGGSYVWRSVSKGTFQFQLEEKGSTGDAYFSHVASGAVRYR